MQAPEDVPLGLARVERSPYGTVAAAVGVGYVLGGGLFTPLTARMVSLGVGLTLRLVVAPLVAERLVALARSAPPGAAHPESNSA